LAVSAYSLSLKPSGTVLEGVARAGRYTFTAAAIGAMFGLTSCVSAQVREKPDDPLNYFIGGCAGGLTPGSAHSQLRDRLRCLRVHGHSSRPGQDGPAGGLGGVCKTQGV
ncbi:NADH dehydrogenase [ubiquinone] 1 alpha subcomplex subunit 11 isoform 1, partial [Daubentonia madagascariensis]